MTKQTSYLPAGLPAPVPEADGLSAVYWTGLQQERLLVQRCAHCGVWQFGPEWICHQCHAFDPAWVEVPALGRVYSWERVWSNQGAAAARTAGVGSRTLSSPDGPPRAPPTGGPSSPSDGLGVLRCAMSRRVCSSKKSMNVRSEKSRT